LTNAPRTRFTVLTTDLRRAILSRSFVLALLGMALCVLFGALNEMLSVFKMERPTVLYGFHEDLFQTALRSDIILLVVPLLAAIPFAAAFVEDVKSGYLKQCLPRTTTTRYLVGKSVSCALSGGLAILGGALLGFLLFTLIFSPMEIYVDFAIPSRMGEIGFSLLLLFLSGALWASVGLLLSTLTMNAFLAYASPFILYYVLVIMQERYFRAAFMLNPKNYLTMQGAFPLEGKSAALTLFMLVMVFLLLFYIIGQRHLRDDNARKTIRSLFPPRKIKADKPFKPRKEWRPLRELRQIGSVARYNFRMWRGNTRIFLTFALAFILCFLLSDKAARFAYDMGTTMQAFEPFVWTFGDANSVLLISLLLILLFVDMPFLGAGAPYFLSRMKRSTWAWGQLVYVILTTALYMAFILISTTLICMQNSFIGNLWSETAAILGYSGAGKAIALPALVKVLEMSRPFQSGGVIFLLMLLYTLLMACFMLFLNIKRGRSAGIVGGFAFSLYGFLLNPQLFTQLFDLPKELTYKANVATGWLSPLNHATYHMHNFGYDLLPKLWMTYAIFGGLIVVLFIGIQLAMRKYSFNFIGTENT